MTPIKTSTGLLIIFAAAALIGGGALAWANAVWPTGYDLEVQMPIKVKKKTAITAPTDETANWKTLTLDFSKGKLKYPATWTLTKFDSTNMGGLDYEGAIYGYDINKNEEFRQIAEYNLTTWLKGPKEEGYNLPNEKRKEALVLMKEIYNEQKLTSSIIEKFKDFSQEFFTYNPDYRTDLKYLSSSDNKSRGFSVINTTGNGAYTADMSPTYHTTLFNPEKNIVVSIAYNIPTTAQEIKAVNERINKLDPNDVKSGEEEYAKFKKLVEITPRSGLSFGNLMDTVDTAIKSLTF